MTVTSAIEQQRAALLRVVLGLFATMGVEPGGSVATVPKHVRLSVLSVLHTAEFALNWLVVAAALEIPVPPSRVHKRRGGRFVRLLDFWRRCRMAAAPLCGRLTVVFQAEGVSSPDEEVSAAEICARLNALFDALNSLPKQARILARAQVRLDDSGSRVRRTRRSEWATRSAVKRDVARKRVRANRYAPAVRAIDSS